MTAPCPCICCRERRAAIGRETVVLERSDRAPTDGRIRFDDVALYAPGVHLGDSGEQMCDHFPIDDGRWELVWFVDTAGRTRRGAVCTNCFALLREAGLIQGPGTWGRKRGKGR